jgi:hypothetical protein
MRPDYQGRGTHRSAEEWIAQFDAAHPAIGAEVKARIATLAAMTDAQLALESDTLAYAEKARRRK